MKGRPLWEVLIDENPNTEYHDKDCTNPGVNAKEKVVAMVKVTNAIVEPRTVVIHFDDAPITDAAMMRSRGLGSDAFSTKASCIFDDQFLNQQINLAVI